MKKCLICGAVDSASAATCMKCGEASWSPVVPSKKSAEPEPETRISEAPVQQYRGKRGRR